MSEHTSFYEKIGITPLINASETYTNLGGSLMDERTVEAMRQAGEHFVDYPLLLQKVSERAAELTNYESAFVTTGAAGGVILSAAAAMCGYCVASTFRYLISAFSMSGNPPYIISIYDALLITSAIP